MNDSYQENINIFIVSMVVIIILSWAFYHYGFRHEIGIYEYIRKVEKQIDAKKYKDAMQVLAKAFKEAPSGENVRKVLLQEYVKCSRGMNDSGNLDAAIECLEKASALDPKDLLVMNDLAILLISKASRLAKDKDHAMAMNRVKKAVDISMKSKKARKNVSIYLFNKAAEAYAKNDPRTVFLFANISYSLWPRVETIKMLAYHFYKEADLEKARFYWEKAVQAAPDDADAKAEFEKVTRELAVRGGMDQVDMGYFKVGLFKEYDIDKNVLSSLLVDIYRKVGNDIGFYLPKGTFITFYAEEDFRKVFDQKGIVRGFYDASGIKIVFIPDINDPMFKAVIAHEYTHAVVSYMTDNNCPPWFNEAMAVFEQKAYAPYPPGHVKAFCDPGGKLSVALLEKGFAQMDDLGLVGLSYEGAYTVVAFITERWGWSSVRKILERMKGREHIANIVDEEFYLSLPAFESMWNEYVREEYLDERGHP